MLREIGVGCATAHGTADSVRKIDADKFTQSAQAWLRCAVAHAGRFRHAILHTLQASRRHIGV